MIRARSVFALVVVVIAFTGCKRQVDVVIPDSGTVAVAKPSASAASTPTATAPDPVEPLATLSSARVTVPVPVAPKTGDAGTALARPTGSALPTSIPTAPPTGVPTATGAEPQECQAAKLMRSLGRTNEAETLRVKCVEKGGKDPFS